VSAELQFGTALVSFDMPNRECRQRQAPFAVAKYARQEMARRTVGPRRSDSLRSSTRIIVISVLVLSGAVAWDLANDGFWSRHALLTGLVASIIVVAVTAALLNEVLERRQRERWSLLAQYALFDLVPRGSPRLGRTARARRSRPGGRARGGSAPGSADDGPAQRFSTPGPRFTPRLSPGFPRFRIGFVAAYIREARSSNSGDRLGVIS